MAGRRDPAVARKESGQEKASALGPVGGAGVSDAASAGCSGRGIRLLECTRWDVNDKDCGNFECSAPSAASTLMTQVVGLAVLHNAAWDDSARYWCITDAGSRLFYLSPPRC